MRPEVREFLQTIRDEPFVATPRTREQARELLEAEPKSATGEWEVDNLHYSDGKSITIIGPSDGYQPMHIYVDHDDVWHPEVERRIPLIVDALNGIDFGPPPTQAEIDAELERLDAEERGE